MSSSRLLLLVLALTTGGAAADTVSVPVPDCMPVSQLQADGQRIRSMGYALMSSPGDPALPFKQIFVILPPNANPASVSVSLTGDSREVLPAASEIAPAPPMATSVNGKETREWGKGKHILSGRNTLVYGNAALYPASNVELRAVGRLRKWRIATLRYYPFRYNPVTHELERSSSGRIVVSYRNNPSAPVTAASIKQLADPVFSQRVKALAANYPQAKAWYSQAAATVSAKSASSQTTTSYVIITTSTIAAASTKLQAFVNHKTSRGFTVAVATEAQWSGGTGDTAAGNIRAYLQANYVTNGIQYVLLIGNPDPAAGDVPMKMLWPRRAADDTYREAPSDYFYADLTGNWDLNGDGYFGEERLDFGPGGVDRLPEVIVGRIPYYGDATALDLILQKTIDYESGVTRGGWVRNVLLSMKPSDSSTPGYQLGEAIKNDAVIPAGMTATRIYHSNYGLTPTPEYTPCTYDNVLTAWQQHAGFHFWWTHGNDTLASDVFNTSNCQYLDDSYPSFTFQCSCLNADPENSENLAYSLLKRGAIATDAATRVSWYYPGEDIYTGSDSNAGMTYDYALKLIRDHLPCGDAHFAMMVEVPDSIWMNHCVFNIYGDPSVQYPMAPIISHTPLGNTENTTQPYLVQADVTATSPLASGNPLLRWNTTGGSDFNASAMTPTSGTTYSGSIPAQPYGTTVYYYLEAADMTGLSSTYPNGAPAALLSFRVEQDSQPPVIVHSPLPDTADKFGPYSVQATVTDDIGVQNVSLYYNINGGSYVRLDMLPQGLDVYKAEIPGPTSSGDTVDYYITATDSSLEANMSRLPAESGCFSFHIGTKIYVAVLNSGVNPPYFSFGNLNAWRDTSNVISSDPAHRFQVSVLTSLKPGPGSLGLAGQDVLVLPDNAVPVDSLQSVADWFVSGKIILTLDSATSYAGYTGWMWPGCAGRSGYGLYGNNDAYWENGAIADDQQICASDPITSGYSLNQIISSVALDAQFYVDRLPSDAHVLTRSTTDPTRAYAAYRDVPGRGRLVMFGPYIRSSEGGRSMVPEDQFSMIREALIAPILPRQLQVTSPNGGEDYQAGDSVRITYTTSGAWLTGDTIKLEYCTGLDAVWRQVPGAESLAYDTGAFSWDTTGLPGSHNYRVRATWVSNVLSDDSDAPFSIIPTIDIAAAKSVGAGELIKLAGKVVTCTVVGYTYVEEPNRRAGIRVTSAEGLTTSALVDIVGTMSTVDGERVISAETTETLGTGAQIRPYAIRAGALGGSAFGLQNALTEYRLVKESDVWVRSFLPAVGLNNIGLLVRLSGSVTALGQGCFYLDDGSNCDDGSGNTGVRVVCPQGVSPTVGGFVLIDAISSTYFDGTNTFRALVIPDADSFRPL